MLKRNGGNKLLRNRNNATPSSRDNDTSISTPPATWADISVNPSTSSSETSSSHRRKLIQFKPTMQIREYINEMGESQKRTMWYTDEEYDQMEAANTEVVKLMLNNHSPKQKQTQHALNGNDKRRLTLRQLGGHTQRGLEKMTPEAWDRTQDIREEAFDAVFREQARQQEQKIYDPLAISNAYQRASLKSKREATDSGLRDERFICKEFGPLEPTGMRLSTSTEVNKTRSVQELGPKDLRPSQTLRSSTVQEPQRRKSSKPDPD